MFVCRGQAQSEFCPALCPARGIFSVLLKYQSLFVCFKKRKNETQIKRTKGDNST